MSTTNNQLDYEWVQALDQAETEVKQVISQLPHDKVHEFTDDLQAWAKRVTGDVLAQRFRVLRNLGYSKASAVTALGVSPVTIYRILGDAAVPDPGVAPVKHEVPVDYIDVTEDFARLGT